MLQQAAKEREEAKGEPTHTLTLTLRRAATEAATTVTGADGNAHQRHEEQITAPVIHNEQVEEKGGGVHPQHTRAAGEQ